MLAFIVEEPFKIGTHRRGEGIVQHRYGDTWQREPSSERERLRIAPASGQVEVLKRLARELPGPYTLLYVLVAPQTGAQPGRYVLQQSLDEREMHDFLGAFREFFEGDARHHLWIGASDGSLLVYDQHDLIYAYGPLDRLGEAATDMGLREAPVEMPFPHTHHFRSTMDSFEERLLSEFLWNWLPLEEEDEA
jgi:hypothetical protein